jgi:opacity protein-like surface antigen/outer membrane protease
MKKLLLGTIALITSVGAHGATAADLPLKAPPPISVYNWSGFYIGAEVGGAVGTANFSDPFGGSIFGDKVTTPGFLAGGQIGYNWQVPNSPWMLGVQADANWLTSDGTNTCFAFSGFLDSATCHAHPDAFGTATARVGYAFGPAGRTLVYAKGGAAWIHENVDTVTNHGDIALGGRAVPNLSTSASFMQMGWTVGAGVEQAIAPGWTVFLEYDYLRFGNSSSGTPESIIQFIPGVNAYRIFPPGTTSANQDIQAAKLGVNYKFGGDPMARWDIARSTAYPIKAAAQPTGWAPGWEFDFGSRFWYSSGKFQWNISAGQAGTGGNSDISRLTYDALTGYTGEYFQRIDSPWGVFTKGNLGLGTVNGGHQNDEDWLLFGATVPYSNTLSSIGGGKLGYGTLDLGYDVLRGAGYKVGAFVGYNYFNERWDTSGCTQIANQFSDCVPAVAGSRLIGTQDSTWQSLRVGLSAETTLFDRLKLSVDIAYLPYVTMTGRDNHLLRATTTFFDQQGTGQGAQLEAILSYYVTDYLNVGVGGRYWTMWTTSGTDTCTGCGGIGVVSPASPARFNTERYGVFLQASYKFSVQNAVVSKY